MREKQLFARAVDWDIEHFFSPVVWVYIVNLQYSLRPQESWREAEIKKIFIEY